tara:strand:+ start:334 stop:1464 length:1131 start_codon:yes stop_codon:yes gene_type:complete
MKNISIILIILLVSACSSIPKSNKEEFSNTLIQKPEFNYKIKSLPQEINVFFYQKNENVLPPREIQGFIANSYFYNSRISYRPIILLTPITDTQCEIEANTTNLNVVFHISNKPMDRLYKECIQQLPKAKTLFVSNNFDEMGFENTFIVSREEEKYKLIQNISIESSRFVVIDSKNNMDKNSIINLLEDYNQEIVSAKTYNNDKTGQSIFSEILLVDRSSERIRKLSRRLSEKVSADLRSREDIDSFFLSVDLKEARNLKPALDYISQKDFDVFILNSWNTNERYQPLEKDLTGSIHSDMPIMMPIQMPKFIGDKNRTREFAIGYDAFEIILLRYGSINPRNFIYKGLTGKIKLGRGDNKRSPYVFEITPEGIKIL